jgi:hypothetical protein
MRKSSFSILIIILGLFYLEGCNSVVQPPDPVELPEVPQVVVDMFNRRFPAATETTMQVVEKDRLWEAQYKLNGQRFYAGMDSTRILRRVRIEAASVPDSLGPYISNSIIGNVVVSNYQEEVESFYRPEKVFTARYRFEDKEYLMVWVGGLRSYLLYSEPFYKFAYPIDSNEKLPENVRALLDAEPLKQIGGLIFVNEKNEKRYHVQATNGDGLPGGDYIFDTNGKLISISYKPQKTFTSVEDAPEHVRNYLAELDRRHRFKFQMGYQMRINDGYWFYLSNDKRESLELVLDKNAEEVERIHTKYIN